MNKTLTFLACSIFFIILANETNAQVVEKSSKTESTSISESFTRSINMCPGGIIFGVYSINYEHLFSNPHGIVLRLDYEAVPKTYTDASIESSGVGFTFNYRYHLSKQMKSFFIGLYTRYKIYSGEGMQESTEFDFTLSELTFGANVGKRWVWNSGFNVTFALGYGVTNEIMESDPASSAIDSTIDIFKDEYDFSGPFYGELSIGYAF